MNQEFVSDIIKVIIKIFKNIKIKKKSMSIDNNQSPQPVQPVVTTIGANTQIIFTVKSFFATLGSILALFLGFYFLVVIPRQEKTEEYQKELMNQQKVQIDAQFKTVNEGIGKNTQSIVALTTRFNDLNEAVESIANTDGGFGGSTTSGTSNIPAVGVNEVALASTDSN
ncbi:MAG: hypothetical protein DRN27_08985 [Thermoplasmata archaeon]|nr:MAG: hypothetical protein DRN27_08985 [Thermoplasmata archaeon]